VSIDCSDAWYGLGMVYFRQRKYRLSIYSLKKASIIQPENSDYLYMLGEAYTGLHKIDQAILAYSRASKLNPLDFEAWMACAQALFKKKRYDEAIRKLLQFCEYNDDNPTVNYRLAAYYTYQGDLTKGLLYFKKGLDLNFPEHRDMFSRFPKMRHYRDFKNLVEHFNQQDQP